MTRDAAIAHAADYFDGGAYRADLTRRVAIRTESQMLADRGAEMAAYFAEMRATLNPWAMSAPITTTRSTAAAILSPPATRPPTCQPC